MNNIEETLGKIITHKKGHAFKSAWYQEEGFPIVKVTNFTDNSVSSSDLVFVDENIYHSKKEYFLLLAKIW